ncbi:translation elongation factor Ts [Patescibacteria group bacterium]|nr:translation elongation factor Ts [Patescibacteria group bacterium]MBU2472713.1 translation elongation factor Ts [Patescibacteria group bacterium]
MILIDQVKQLRKKTNFSIMECKKALEETKGDEKKALKILEKKGAEKAVKKSDREAKQGLIEAYIHNNGKIGVILELNCETDFVARNKEFKQLARDIAMHITAMSPKDSEELLSQVFIKDEEKTIQNLVTEAVGKLGENIKIGKFIRLEI